VRNGERSADDPEVLATAEDLRIAKLVSRIDKAIDDAPALTDAQRERIASILRAGVAS
jgi:hypothetical protein